MLRVKPRKERTVWKTVDGRLLFRRHKGQWIVKSATHTSDTKILVQSGLMNEDHTCSVGFSSLQEARQAAQEVFSSMDDSPDFRLRHHAVAYWVEGQIATVCRWPSGWTVDRNFRAFPKQQQRWMHNEPEYGWMRFQGFPTRKAALQALERWMATGELPKNTS